MPSKKKKGENTNYKLTREPLKDSHILPKEKVANLYPDLSAEKENKYFSSSDDSPENKYPYRLTPRIQAKNNSPSNPEAANVTRHRSGRQQQNQINMCQDNAIPNIHPESNNSENSDEDIETDNWVHTDYLYKLRQKTPELDKQKDSTQARKKLNFHELHSQSLQPQLITQASDSIFPSFFVKIGILMAIVFSLLFSIIFFQFFSYPTTLYKSDPLSAVTIINDLKSKFKNQPKLTFRIIGSALKNVLNDKPKSPAIILLLATNGTKTICNDFALRLIELLSVPIYTIKISGENYKQENVSKAKLDIDQHISKVLNINQLGAVLIYDLDQIPGQAALILHKYFDHEHAPFKRAVFIMTANYNKPIDNFFEVEAWDKAANDHLHSVWTDTGIDQLSALLSRLTVSVAIITTETL